jgi:hypothetical protein
MQDGIYKSQKGKGSNPAYLQYEAFANYIKNITA